jgi:hypothetical protein
MDNMNETEINTKTMQESEFVKTRLEDASTAVNDTVPEFA